MFLAGEKRRGGARQRGLPLPKYDQIPFPTVIKGGSENGQAEDGQACDQSQPFFPDGQIREKDNGVRLEGCGQADEGAACRPGRRPGGTGEKPDRWPGGRGGQGEE